MEKVFTEFSFYHQIMLWDVEDRKSTAYWFSGNEMIVFGPKGINVGVKNDTNIEITVRLTEEPAGILNKILKSKGITTDYQCLASGVVQIGKQGIGIGSPTSDGFIIEWNEGLTLVEVWVEEPRNGTKVLFLLQHLPKGYEWLYDQDYEK